jgi:predicted PurR-regulated permease PerM
MLAYDYPLLGAFWTITIFFAWAAWIFIVIWVFVDNFRRHDHSGWAKALWTLVIIFVPILGVLVYLIARPRELATV